MRRKGLEVWKEMFGAVRPGRERKWEPGHQKRILKVIWEESEKDGEMQRKIQRMGSLGWQWETQEQNGGRREGSKTHQEVKDLEGRINCIDKEVG